MTNDATPEPPDPNPAAGTPTNAAPAPVTPAAPEPADEAPGLLTRLARAIDRALAERPKLTGWALTCHMILDSLGGQSLLCGPKVLEKFRELQRRHDNAVATINAHTRPAARDAWIAHGAKLADAIGGGTVTEHRGRTREDFDLDFEAKVRASHEEMRRVYRESLPWCREIFDRFSEIANDRVEGMETHEREQHQNFGVRYVGPSNLIVSFKKAIETAGHRVTETPGGNLSVRDMIPYLDF
jgi:hypothetical protein